MSQPTPFEVRDGILTDSTGRPVNFNILKNLKSIAKAFVDEEDIENLRERAEELSSHNSELEGSNTDYESRIEELEKEVGELESDVEDLKKKCTEFDQNIRNEMRDIKEFARGIIKAADCVIEEYTE